jgi:hypothetical protein
MLQLASQSDEAAGAAETPSGHPVLFIWRENTTFGGDVQEAIDHTKQHAKGVFVETLSIPADTPESSIHGLAQELIERHPGATVVTDETCKRALADSEGITLSENTIDQLSLKASERKMLPSDPEERAVAEEIFDILQNPRTADPGFGREEREEREESKELKEKLKECMGLIFKHLMSPIINQRKPERIYIDAAYIYAHRGLYDLYNGLFSLHRSKLPTKTQKENDLKEKISYHFIDRCDPQSIGSQRYMLTEEDIEELEKHTGILPPTHLIKKWVEEIVDEEFSTRIVIVDHKSLPLEIGENDMIICDRHAVTNPDSRTNRYTRAGLSPEDKRIFRFPLDTLAEDCETKGEVAPEQDEHARQITDLSELLQKQMEALEIPIDTQN